MFGKWTAVGFLDGTYFGLLRSMRRTLYTKPAFCVGQHVAELHERSQTNARVRVASVPPNISRVRYTQRPTHVEPDSGGSSSGVVVGSPRMNVVRGEAGTPAASSSLASLGTPEKDIVLPLRYAEHPASATVETVPGSKGGIKKGRDWASMGSSGADT